MKFVQYIWKYPIQMYKYKITWNLYEYSWNKNNFKKVIDYKLKLYNLNFKKCKYKFLKIYNTNSKYQILQRLTCHKTWHKRFLRRGI